MPGQYEHRRMTVDEESEVNGKKEKTGWKKTFIALVPVNEKAKESHAKQNSEPYTIIPETVRWVTPDGKNILTDKQRQENPSGINQLGSNDINQIMSKLMAEMSKQNNLIGKLIEK